jgi:tetratricopeptide (TPR) repeat protein
MLANADTRPPIGACKFVTIVTALLGFACVLVATVSPAHAIRLRLPSDRIVKLQDTDIKGPNGEELFLGYHPSRNEYVLGIKNNSTIHYELNETQIKDFQARRLLPTPLPPYVPPPMSDEVIYGIVGFLIFCALGWAWKFYVRWRRKRAIVQLDDAVARHRAGNLDAAIESYTQAIAIDRKLAPAYNLRGNAYEAKGDAGKAVADYSKAIKVAPKLVAPWVDRGNLMERQGQFDLAIADFTRVIKLAKKDSAGYARRGRVYLRKGELDRGIADLTKAIKITPAFAEAYRFRAWAYAKQGRSDLARADEAKADTIAGTQMPSAPAMSHAV